MPHIGGGIPLIAPRRQVQIAPAPERGRKINGKDGQNSNACLYIVVGHGINPPTRGSNAIQAELRSRPGRATEDSARAQRGKAAKKGGKGCAAQSRARGSRSSAG